MRKTFDAELQELNYEMINMAAAAEDAIDTVTESLSSDEDVAAHEAMELTNKAVAEALDGLPAHKLHCSVLAEEAIKNALKDYFDRNGIPYDEKVFPNCDHCEHCK